MFLKNDSNFQCGLRTKKEVLTIKPGQVVHVLDVDILTINSKLVKVSEEEYNRSLSLAQPVNEPVEEVQTEVDQLVIDDKQPEVPEVEVVITQPVENEQSEEVEQEHEGLEALEAKLEELKIKWQEASRPNRKEAIQKQIKEVQDKINKLQ